MKKILIVAAHPDDEVLGCGGTIARFVRENKDVVLLILSDGESSRVNSNFETRQQALMQSCKVLGIKEVIVKKFDDSGFDTNGILAITRAIEDVVRAHQPDSVFTHFPHDANQDHQWASKATVVAVRSVPNSVVKNLFYYEVPSSSEWGDGEVFKPQLYIELSDEDVQKKIQALKAYQQEMRPAPHPRSEEVIAAKLVVRGSECGQKCAEAFQVRFQKI